KAIVAIKKHYMQRKHGDRDFVELLLLVQTEGLDTVDMACEIAIEDKTTHLSAIINQIHRLTDVEIKPLQDNMYYPKLEMPPQANCERYNQLINKTEILSEVCL
ncbi:MAG: hypothetical protein KAI17_27085, partial [Thiotrichaceae bacterium]|nr:hypothetical protein [Thiotrichaceae bacterium]